MSEKTDEVESLATETIWQSAQIATLMASVNHPHVQPCAFFPITLSEDFGIKEDGTTLSAHGKLYDTAVFMAYISIKVPEELREAARLAVNLLASRANSSIFFLTHEVSQIYSVYKITIGTVPSFSAS